MRKKYLALLMAYSLALGSLSHADGRVRRISVHDDQIVTVKTALGVATIVQVPDKPNSVVVGDMNAYKVEYLDTAITIKPLSGHAKSNVYIYTDYRRFNVELVTGSEASADYVVYLENPKEDKSKKQSSSPNTAVHWMQASRSMKNADITFKVSRFGQNSVGHCFIEFTITSIRDETLNPAWFWLTQKGVSHPIQGLALSSLKVTQKIPVQGSIEVLRSDLIETEPMRVELRLKKQSYLTLQEVNLWKH